MASELESFRDHCRTMAATEHVSTCAKVVKTGAYAWQIKTVRPDPDCEGCVTDADRALFGRLAAEVDEYLGVDDQEGLFAEDVTR